ncbi:Regulator of chromosome condensation (RCC1) repeat protein [compost metagenome]
MALQTNGTLWTMGDNRDGQSGSGFSYEADALPVKVGNLSTWTKISAGGYTMAALQSNGSAWAWGYNNRGQVGDESTTTRSSPTRIGADVNWTEISVGDYHVLGIRS